MWFNYSCQQCKQFFSSAANAYATEVLCPHCGKPVCGDDIIAVKEGELLDRSATPEAVTPPSPSRPPIPIPPQTSSVSTPPVIPPAPIDVPPVMPPPAMPPVPDVEPVVESAFEETVFIGDAPLAEAISPVDTSEESADKDTAETDETYFLDDEPAETNYLKYVVILLVALIAGAVITWGVMSYLKGQRDEEQTEPSAVSLSPEEQEEQVVAALADFAKEHPNLQIRQYYKVDMDNDSIAEVIAKLSDRLLVYAFVDSAAVAIFDQPVQTWVWAEGRGLFALTDDGGNSGSARWYVKDGSQIKADDSKGYFHYSGNLFYENVNGKDLLLTGNSYLNKIQHIGNVEKTRLKPIDLKP